MSSNTSSTPSGRTRLAAATALAALIGGGVLAVSAAGSDPASTTPADRTLTLSIDESSFSGHDAKPKGDSAGDTWQAAGRVTENGANVGRLELSTTLLDERYRGAMQTGVLVLRDGTITFEAVEFDKRPPSTHADASELAAITGGTAAYVGARGELRITEANKKGTVVTAAVRFTP